MADSSPGFRKHVIEDRVRKNRRRQYLKATRAFGVISRYRCRDLKWTEWTVQAGSEADQLLGSMASL